MVFEELRSAAPDDWIVLHSLDIAPSAERRRGEADFVVIVPGRGVAVLEIKSVATQDVDRLWHFGRCVTSSRSPFGQADTAMRAIMSFLQSARLNRRPFLCSGVVTPFGDITTDASAQSTIEWNEWQAIGRSAIQARGLVRSVERLIAKELESEKRTALDFDANSLAALLRPRFEFYLSAPARRERRDDEIRRYTEEQFDALDDFDANSQLVVVGPAGCGKTLLALELVRRAAEVGHSVLFVCYNRLLGEWLKEQVVPIGYLATASRLDAFMLSIAGQHTPATPDDDTFWTEDLPLTAAARFAGVHEPFDLLVVDEAQDMMTPERLMFLDEALLGGLHDGRWVFFGDFDSQDVQSGRGARALPELLEDALGRKPYVRRLRRNCRNTQRVARFAQRVAALPESLGYSACLRPELGETPRVIELGSRDMPEQALAAVITRLMDDGYSNEEIVILSACTPESSIAARLAVADHWRDVLSQPGHPARGKIRYDSIRRFKGMEAVAVVLTDLEQVTTSGLAAESVLRDLVYVGATRSIESATLITSQGVAHTLGLRAIAEGTATL